MIHFASLWVSKCSMGRATLPRDGAVFIFGWRQAAAESVQTSAAGREGSVAASCQATSQESEPATAADQAADQVDQFLNHGF